jgi:hypothetical protein
MQATRTQQLGFKQTQETSKFHLNECSKEKCIPHKELLLWDFSANQVRKESNNLRLEQQNSSKRKCQERKG